MSDKTISTTAHRPSWRVPRPEGALGLEEWCKWLNFLDAILTAHALTEGRHTEWNFFMRLLWNTTPLAYGTAKFWLFWFGLKCLERAAEHRVQLLQGVFVVFLLVFLWHLFVLVPPPS